MGMKGALGRDQFMKCLEFFLKGDNIFQTITGFSRIKSSKRKVIKC